ncbi:mitotic checkpoint serine/threonine-protein kinase BUB1 [Olea europaea var. sylvestris]|uniref:mitotic checkpoint serine/threonine-protein kinase BUB1 n=1 Tax=Olea europaea var. sylvestris TaxID=158386 RepID=UPI000C1D297B|nr:mitotic checkpoint serine/threonine-protein kinase BUB1 [Olea europaea var. sylvestris]
MVVITRNVECISNPTATDDPLLPWLQSIEKALQNSIQSNSSTDLDELVSKCIYTFNADPRYRDDVRFLKIWFLHMDGSSDYERVFKEMERNKICLRNALLYESFALFLEVKGKLIDACMIYHLGISRNAQPLGRLKKAQVLFLERMSERVTNGSFQKMENDVSSENGENFVNPWSVTTLKNLLQKMNSRVVKYEGYHQSNKAYPGKVSLSSLQKSARQKTIDIGGYKYQIKGCAGQGGFAQVFKAYVDNNPDDVVALKIQKPPFPWEFYMYRQLDMRISEKERMNFGFAHRLHLYSDYSILVSDYLAHGTLQDAINSNAVIGGSMEEVLCIYYTIELLHILEILHDTAIIHGDFKPDNLLIRYSRDDLTESKDDFLTCSGPWRNQGLCLVDWGRGIDLSLFPEKTKFIGDSRTSGFRCIEMQENKPWIFQVDTYGMCVIVHMMLHNSYMAIEKKASLDGGYVYQPKSHYKRYWNIELWRSLFTKLLNINPSEDHKKLLQSLRESFQDYMCSDPKLIKKLKQLLLKQRTSLCSS